jgi:hypothetical protein
MAARRTVRVKTRERRELEYSRDHDARPYVRERCGAVLKMAEGQTPHAVARQGLLKPRDPDTLYGWLEVYEAEGVAGLLVPCAVIMRRVAVVVAHRISPAVLFWYTSTG